MVNKLKKTTNQAGKTSKFFSSVAFVGSLLLFVLKPGISKANTELKAELIQTLKNVPVKEWKIVEAEQANDNTYYLNKTEQQLDSIAPDTTTIKNFFLNG
jgi:hypothetical protein